MKFGKAVMSSAMSVDRSKINKRFIFADVDTKKQEQARGAGRFAKEHDDGDLGERPRATRQCKHRLIYLLIDPVLETLLNQWGVGKTRAELDNNSDKPAVVQWGQMNGYS